MASQVPKAGPYDFLGRFREIVSDPCNRLIRRVPYAGFVGHDPKTECDFVIMHNGVLVPRRCYYGNFADILIVNRGVHEPQEELVFGLVMPEVPDGEPMVELGAYWGFYSAWFKRCHPSSSVYLVEPKREHLAVGQQTFQLNAIEGNFVQGFVGAGGMNFGQFCEQNSIRDIGVLHADIQGAEVELLQDIRPILEANRIRFLFVSTHGQVIHENCRSFLESVGYRVIADVDYDAGTYACDGLVVAAVPSVAVNALQLPSRASGATIDNYPY